MPIATSKDQKQNTNRFLLFPAALSIWTFRIGGNGVAEHGVLDIGGSDASYISSTFSTAANSGHDLEPSNSYRTMTLEAFLSLKGALQMNQQYSWSHVQKDRDCNGHSEHLHDHAPTCP
jgi:hypothetical protein